MACSVTAGLIDTAMFVVSITIPGGNKSDSGYLIIHKSVVFKVYAVVNMVSLFTSIISLLMFLAVYTLRYAEEYFLYTLPKRVLIGMVTLFLSIFSMMMAFNAALYLVFFREKTWAIYLLAPVTILPSVSFVRLEFRLFIDVVFSAYSRGAFGKQICSLLRMFSLVRVAIILTSNTENVTRTLTKKL
ncbi:uncharacterized protein LOC125195003 [Salvia hispanica]|uniref:uncharacterized protein LOC125195003 n=1 Tax=Salvia hispanica TaxID=49212 RepID=UPI002008F318|nr:uncharacterized protein LOC125195003 [Salvia hispanica]